jgi:hypothetical protein
MDEDERYKLRLSKLWEGYTTGKVLLLAKR